ncbi:MAG: hypothetical protein A3K09_01975 [Nitrospinae bacterium RIFCSPLOWO2_12_FULL_47_7]|nr:MAG: hypothetical protein A3K09_01975 [Nitrospinae bacterium RIFCSPLOWO2_12_FULL_47_7]
MSTRIRFSRKKLKEPDEFLTLTDRLVHYCMEKRAVVSSVVLGILILLGAVYGVHYYQQMEAVHMESLLVEMENIRSQIKNKQPGQVITDLETTLGKFNESGQKHRARLLLADVYYKNQQFDKSIELYSDVLKGASIEDLSHNFAQLGLAYSYESKKEYKKAIGAYRAIIDNKTASLPLLTVYLDLVRCYEFDHDKKNALLLLREAKNKFKSIADMETIDRRISRLEGEI